MDTVHIDDDDDHSDYHDSNDLEDFAADELFATLPDPTPSDPFFQQISTEELLITQQQDPFCQTLRKRLEEGVVRAFGINNDGLLVRKSEHGPQIVIPHALKARVLHIHHYARLGGHPGGRKLYQTIRRHMYWPACAVDCYATARRCPTCARNRIKLRKNTTELQLFPATAPLESVAIDVLGELIQTARGNQYILVISDRFTKLTKTVPMKGLSASEVAKHFVNEWVFNYGAPKELLSDNGGCFTAKFFQDVCRILNVHNLYTTTYHAQTNGQVERYNRTIKAAIRSYLGDHPKDWDLYTPALTYAYNCQPHSSTALAPFELVLSRPPTALALQAQSRKEQTPKEARDTWKSWLKSTLQTAKGKLDQAQARYKRNYDARLRRQTEKIVPDDWVFLRVERRDEREHRHKLAAVADGPYKVNSTHGGTVVIQRPDNSVERVSRSRVVLAPQPRTVNEIQNAIRPLTDEEVIPDTFPMEDGTTNDGTPVNETRATQVANQANSTPVEDEQHTTQGNGDDIQQEPGPNMDQDNMDHTPLNGEHVTQTGIDTTRPQPESKQYVIDKIIDHGENDDENHEYAKVGQTLYRVRWYGYTAKDDTWEPVDHLPRSKVLSYCRRRRLEMPGNIDDSMTG